MSEKKVADGKYPTGIICGAVLLAAVLLVAALFLYPRVRAGREFRALRERLSEAAVSVLLTDPMTGHEALLEGDDAAPFLSLLRSSAEAAKYHRKTDSDGGNWDPRAAVTLPDGSRVLLYLTEDGELYFSRGITQFRFSLPDRALWDALCAALVG